METYQVATWALGVYGGMMSEAEIAKKVGLSKTSINNTKAVNEKLSLMTITDKGSKLKKELYLGLVAKKVGMVQATISKVNTLNEKLFLGIMTDKKTDLIKKLNLGEISFEDRWKHIKQQHGR